MSQWEFFTFFLHVLLVNQNSFHVLQLNRHTQAPSLQPGSLKASGLFRAGESQCPGINDFACKGPIRLHSDLCAPGQRCCYVIVLLQNNQWVEIYSHPLPPQTHTPTPLFAPIHLNSCFFIIFFSFLCSCIHIRMSCYFSTSLFPLERNQRVSDCGHFQKLPSV